MIKSILSSAKSALILGGSSGLGLAIAKNLAEKYHLILTGRSPEKLKQAQELMSRQNMIQFFSGDLTSSDVLGDLVNQLDKHDIIPDVIIYALGGKVSGDQQPLTVDVLRRSICLNLEVAVAINQHFLPKMLERKHGRIIHVSSDCSLTGNAAPGYAAAKSAVNAYVKSTARFYARYGVMLCAVLPGIFEHEASAWSIKRDQEPEHYQQRINQMPLGRFGRVDEIAYFVANLASTQNMMCAGSLIELTGAA
jgi:3-oxoacyl-[acyl-carrier protein] reductase